MMLKSTPPHPTDGPMWKRSSRARAIRENAGVRFGTPRTRTFALAGGDGNRAVLQSRVTDGREPGVLAYVEGLPAGWAGIAPRSEFDRLVRNKQSLRAVDDRPVWSLNCLAVRREYRKQGLMRLLIRGAVDFALAKGAIAVEAYPVEADRKLTHYDLFYGSLAAYEDLGFVEVARHSSTRPIMRYWPGD